MSGARAFVFAPADGKAVTLDDLAEFVAEAIGKGLPGSSYVHAAGVIEFDMHNGPRIARLTVLPEEVSRVQ